MQNYLAKVLNEFRHQFQLIPLVGQVLPLQLTSILRKDEFYKKYYSQFLLYFFLCDYAANKNQLSHELHKNKYFCK